VQNKLGSQGQTIFGEVERCHPKKATWMKLSHLNHLLEMVEIFELKKGHELG